MSNGIRWKHRSLDKHEAYIPTKRSFMHDDYYVSSNQEQFHTETAYVSMEYRSRSFGYGIQKKLFRVSGRGIGVDSYYVGQSDY